MMPDILIDNVQINFPFEPYEEQRKYMMKVIECVTQRKVGILESPTGTGKTLSLLCATLGWLSKNRCEAGATTDGTSLDDSLPPGEEPFAAPKYLFPRVIYASRTHSQLSKAMSELKKTAYRNFNVTILGSRDQMCVHPQVMNEPNLTLKNALCSMHMKAKSCHFGNNVEKIKKDGNIFPEGIVDLEDLVTKSKNKDCCPYYLARDLQARADIVFMPYNYLFDYQIRKALKISLTNAIIILDEAHNIDKVCEEASSVTIKSSDIALAITDITKEMLEIHEDFQNGFMVDRGYSTDELCFVKEKLTALEAVIDEFPVTKDNSITKSGVYIFELLQKAGINYDVSIELIRLLSVIYEFLSNARDVSTRGGGSLKKFADDLEVIFSSIKNANVLVADKDFRVHIEEESFKNIFVNKNALKTGNKPAKIVNYWCFNPGYCLGNTVKEEVRCVILTSGTLAPLTSYAKEMQLKNPVSVECSHIVSNDQVLVLKLESGPRNVPLRCTFANRQNPDYWHEFGLSLQNYFRIIPDGLLIFFPGYATLNVAVKMWRESGIWDKLVALKPIFTEPQQKSELQQICLEYYKAIDTGNGRGAVFLGVCRGKISEGLDFSNEYGRGVIVAGLPYPPLFDPKVKLKKQYIDLGKKTSEDMTGETWYLLEATKAVNQAIGRVIRHNKDYGAIILCDAQFNNPNIVQNLSKWIQEKIKKPKCFGESVGALRSFFRKNKNPVVPSPTKSKAMQSAIQPSFSNTSTSQQRSDLKCLESYLARISENVNKGSFSFPSPSFVTSSKSELSFTNITDQSSLKKLLKIIFNILCYYEDVCNLTLPVSTGSKSCLESLSAHEDSLNNPSMTSLNLFNSDSLRNEDKLSVLNRVLEEFEEKKKSLPSPPKSVFEVDETSFASGSSQIESSEYNGNLKFDHETSALLVSLISRLHKLNRHLSDNKSNKTAFNFHITEASFEDTVLPAKRRKIKLDPVKIEDIQLSGSDKRSRNREKRLNDTKNFLLELKGLLEPSSYYSLINLIKAFTSKEDFDKTVNYLRALFPEKDEEFKDIFKRCYLLFNGEWEKEFLKYCETNLIL